MNKRKSFIIHKDSLDVLDKLNDEQAGKLFKAIKSYQQGESENLDQLTSILLSPFTSQFKRDDEKYERICERNKTNGNKGGRPKKELETRTLEVSSQDVPKEEEQGLGASRVADGVLVQGDAEEVFYFWCLVMRKDLDKTKMTPRRKKYINDRIEDGYTVEEIKQAIVNCSHIPHNMGLNDNRKRYNSIELICRSPEKLEYYLDPQVLNTEVNG